MADADDAANNQPAGYVPPRVWTWDKESGGRFANINRPISGATHDKELPVGRHPMQLYSLGTPNGQKVTIMLEELLALLDEYRRRLERGEKCELVERAHVREQGRLLLEIAIVEEQP